ncbi:MAG: dimethylhistidine N-methyltransferase [Phycisphaerales bacterium]|nr:dimethylhistidine N-methyltransferase [Phycisphaerales bacterium]MDB5354496.1 dimethylhistidine N-methyltransferase [Phycisphaerales bacterium]
MRINSTAIQLEDTAPASGPAQSGHEAFADEARRGLRKARKELPCKFFYDAQGSRLFDRICDLDEYYLSRTETSILMRYAGEMARALGPRCTLIEYGSGSSVKTRILLDRAHDLAAYVPIDISGAHLHAAARELRLEYPGLAVVPVCADYTQPFDLPGRCASGRRCVFFPGSSIGNFDPEAARDFLRSIRAHCGGDGALLIGVDLKKDPALLHAAYNDREGVTAQFNLNLLARINRELEGDFDLSQFAHYAFYHPVRGRIEMHLTSLCEQDAWAAGERFHFREGEAIFTESSYKYTPEEFGRIAADSGYRVENQWTDPQRWFSVQLLRAV